MWFRYIYEQAMYPYLFHYLLTMLAGTEVDLVTNWQLFWMYFNWRKGIKFLIEFCLFLSRCLGLSRVWKDGVTNPKDDYDRYEYERYMNKSGAIWQKFFITRNEDILVTVAFTRHLYNFPRISTLSGTFDGCREVVHMNLFKK